MTSSIAKILIISIPFIHGTLVFGAEDLSLQNQLPYAMKSLMPLSANQLNEVTVKKSPKDKKKGASANEPHVSLQNDITYGGGYGGNEQTSMLVYDGLPYHLAALTIRRDDKNKICFLENQNVGIFHYNFWGSLKLVSYECASANKYHNGVYWNETLEIRNGGYSSDNDALYASTMINRMYEEWFGIPATQNADGSPLPIKIVTHMSKVVNAYLDDDNQIILGDGDKNNYPFTSPGVVSFVMAYIFTAQHSNLEFSQDSTSGAISVAFNSMADQALKFYINGQSDWQIGSEISKTGQPFYYMDQPSKDCGSRTPGDNCSIDHMSQYKPTMEIHYSSGIYRRAFYLLATTPDWDVKKVFSLMVQANRFYWTSNQDFSQGVCGLIKAARDFQYDESAVIDAFNQVGVSPQAC